MRARSLFALATVPLAALLAVAGCAETETGSGNGATPVNRSTAPPSRVAAPAASPGPVSPSVAAPPSATPPQTPPAPPPAPPPVQPPTSAEPDPATVVEEFYAAINAGDYATAWRLGGDNLGESYAAFAAGFADTLNDQLTVTGTSGSTVYVDLTALHTDGTLHEYAGSYVVHNGQITYGSLRELTAPAPGAPNPPPAGSVPHALCRDGTISYSTHDEGTCSDHGGVSVWYWH